MLARLAAEILFRCLDAGVEIRGRMPGPAWVVKHAPGERDQIRIADADDRLRLVIIGDEPDGDHDAVRRDRGG